MPRRKTVQDEKGEKKREKKIVAIVSKRVKITIKSLKIDFVGPRGGAARNMSTETPKRASFVPSSSS